MLPNKQVCGLITKGVVVEVPPTPQPPQAAAAAAAAGPAAGAAAAGATAALRTPKPTICLYGGRALAKELL